MPNICQRSQVLRTCAPNRKWVVKLLKCSTWGIHLSGCTYDFRKCSLTCRLCKRNCRCCIKPFLKIAHKLTGPIYVGPVSLLFLPKLTRSFTEKWKKVSSLRNAVLMRFVNLGCTLQTVIKRKEEQQTFPWVSYEELWRSRRVLSVEAVGRGG